MRHAPQAPYALAALHFPLASLVSHSARLPLGGERELSLVAFMAARLSRDLLPSSHLDPDLRPQRALAARQWFSTLTVPAPVRAELTSLLDALVRSAAVDAAGAWDRLLPLLGKGLDPAARGALAELATALRGLPGPKA